MHAPPENFENLHAVMAILVFFLINSKQLLFRFFDPNFECFAKYDAYCSHILDYACLMLMATEEVRKYAKLYARNIFENGWWGGDA